MVMAVALMGALLGCSGSDEGAGDQDERVGWRVGSCVHQVDGPTTIPADVSAEEREVMLAQQMFEPVACSDERALSRITDLGAELDPFGDAPADDGCPDDTDVAYEGRNAVSGLSTRVMCARNLEPPHPGDPGGGAGNYLVGDCVFVFSSISAGVVNDQVPEVPCDQPGWFATIVAMAPAADACPPEALSRLASPQQPGTVLCLARDGTAASGGTMLAPGDCVDFGTSQIQYPPQPIDCGDPLARRLDAFAEQPGVCPDGGPSEPTTGYDRELCLS
jgi:hypothetical protein